METLFAKTPATFDEIRRRVAYALDRHPLCRNVRFEASEIVADIQDAYELTAAA